MYQCTFQSQQLINPKGTVHGLCKSVNHDPSECCPSGVNGRMVRIKAHLPKSSMTSATTCMEAAVSGCSSPSDFFLTARQRCASGRAWLALPAPLSSATSDVRQLKVSGWCRPDTDWYTCSTGAQTNSAHHNHLTVAPRFAGARWRDQA